MTFLMFWFGTWPCRFALHSWAKWKVTDRPKVYVDGDDSQPTVGLSIVQERECQACGLTEQRITTRYL